MSHADLLEKVMREFLRQERKLQALSVGRSTTAGLKKKRTGTRDNALRLLARRMSFVGISLDQAAVTLSQSFGLSEQYTRKKIRGCAVPPHLLAYRDIVIALYNGDFQRARRIQSDQSPKFAHDVKQLIQGLVHLPKKDREKAVLNYIHGLDK